MQSFPGEEGRTAQVQFNLRDQFVFVRRVLQCFADLEMDPWFRRAEVEHDVAKSVLMLQAQVCRLYRSIYEECGRAEAFCARLPLRSMYESVMAMDFILRPEVCIRAKIKYEAPKKPKIDANGRPVANAVVIAPSRANSYPLCSVPNCTWGARSSRRRSRHRNIGVSGSCRSFGRQLLAASTKRVSVNSNRS